MKRTRRTFAGMSVLAVALALTALGTVGAHGAAAGPPDVSQRVEFNKLVQQRNRLHLELTRLDARASGLIKRGEQPLAVHAEQVSVQDRLDLVELRLALLATRYGLAVPPLPGRDPLPDGAGHTGDGPSPEKIDRAFARGRERALERLRQDGYAFLASLDFREFLED